MLLAAALASPLARPTVYDSPMTGTSAKVGIGVPGDLEASLLDTLSDIAGSVVGAPVERGCLPLGGGVPSGYNVGQVSSKFKRA